jgi:hypothetical protein
VELVEQEALTLAPTPILLAGIPPLCTGPLLVHNPRPTQVRIKTLRIRSKELPRFAVGATASMAPPASDDELLHLRFVGRLKPSERKELQAQLAVPLGTAPGSYTAQVTMGDGVERAVAVVVLEHRATRLHPNGFAHSVEAGQKLRFHVCATNVGNVPSTISLGVPVLYHAADRDWMDHFHAAAKAAANDGFSAFSDAFVARMGGDEPPVGRAKVLDGAGALAPQESRLLHVEVSVPDSLPPGREYLAALQLGDGGLDFTLKMTASAASPR